MEGRPVRNPSVETTREESGEISVKLPRRRSWWLDKLAKWGRIPDYRIVSLDKIGTEVWENCDGEHSVKDLVALHAERHKLARKEAELSMVQFLKQLAQRGIIVLVIDEEKKESDEDSG